MSEKFYTILTNIGKSKIANFAINGEEVKFVKLKVGDGNGKYYNPIENQKDLINTVWEGKIGNIQIDKDNPNWIVIESIIPPEVGDFTIREYGAFDEEDNLLAISKCPETYKPTISNGSTKELIIKMILSVSNTESISFEVDPNIMLAKNSKVDEIDKKVNYTISQLKDCAKNISQISNPNLLINGDFQVWQRGNEMFYTDTSSYLADRWRVHHKNTHMSKQPTNNNNISNNCIRIVNKGTESGQLYLMQAFEEYLIEYLENSTMTLSFWIKGYNSNNSLGCRIGSTGGKTIKLSNDWQKVTLTTLSVSFDKDKVYNRGLLFYSTSATSFDDNSGFDITNVKLELGSVATPFIPRSYGEELALCQRYFRIIGASGKDAFIAPYLKIAETTFESGIRLEMPMRIAPTVLMDKTKFRIRDSAGATSISSLNASASISCVYISGQTPNTLSYNAGFIQRADGITDAKIFLDSEIY